MDYSSLGRQIFEMLCARLLQASGYELQQQSSKSRDWSRLRFHGLKWKDGCCRSKILRAPKDTHDGSSPSRCPAECRKAIHWSHERFTNCLDVVAAGIEG